MNLNAANLEGFLQAHVGPGLAGIGAFVNAVTPAHRVPCVVLARAHPQNVRVATRNGYIADRHRVFLFEYRCKRGTVVGRLKQPPRGGGHIKRKRIPLNDREIHNATAHARRPQRPPLQAVSPLVNEFFLSV